MDFPILIIWMSPFSFLGTSGVFFSFFISFFDEIDVSKQPCLLRHNWDYSVCLCPIKRTPGLYGLSNIVVCSLKMSLSENLNGTHRDN